MADLYFVPTINPKNGIDIINNHLFRYQGGSIEKNSHVFPVRRDGSYTRIGVWSKKVYSDHIDKNKSENFFYVLGKFTEPRSLKGDILLVQEPFSYDIKNRSSWIFSSAQRRVRRAPDVAYDGVGNGSEGMITADQVDGFNGATDRYDWKLIGKKTLIIPYNSYDIGNKNINYSEVIQQNTVNPSLLRYEFHRVWIINAKLKNGKRHIYHERFFYIDEDSWTIVMEEVLTKKGEIWKVALHGLIQNYFVTLPIYNFSLYHDLNNQTYLLTGLDNEINKRPRYGFRAKRSDFEPNALRRMQGFQVN